MALLENRLDSIKALPSVQLAHGHGHTVLSTAAGLNRIVHLLFGGEEIDNDTTWIGDNVVDGQCMCLWIISD